MSRTAYARRPETDNEPLPPLEPDYCSAEGAHTLKQRIEAYWRERGRNVEICVVGESRGDGLGVVFGLRSDI